MAKDRKFFGAGGPEQSDRAPLTGSIPMPPNQSLTDSGVGKSESEDEIISETVTNLQFIPNDGDPRIGTARPQMSPAAVMQMNESLMGNKENSMNDAQTNNETAATATEGTKPMTVKVVKKTGMSTFFKRAAIIVPSMVVGAAAYYAWTKFGKPKFSKAAEAPTKGGK